jgi:hypothetical protein
LSLVLLLKAVAFVASLREIYNLLQILSIGLDTLRWDFYLIGTGRSSISVLNALVFGYAGEE